VPGILVSDILYQYAVAYFLFLLVTFILVRVDLLTPHAECVVLRKNLQSTFCVIVKVWLHLDMYIWVPSFWTLRILKSQILGAIWNFSKRTGLP